MNLKSERLKKLERELYDLEQWLKLALVPKKDIEKHKLEIEGLKKKVDEEKERLRFLKESGEVEEYSPPKRGARASYQEPQSMPDIAVGENSSAEETSLEGETESFEAETQTGEETVAETADSEVNSQFYDEDEDPFSDRNRWKRGVLEDPDADQW